MPSPMLTHTVAPAPLWTPVRTTGSTGDWRALQPVLRAGGLTLRPLRRSDAPSLLALLAIEEVARFVSPPPTTVEGFERMIAWTEQVRQEGTYACFAVVPRGLDAAVGLFQLRALTPDFAVAEWGFALGTPFWGSGLFVDGARLTLDFAVDVVGVQRVEARAVTLNGRGNGALMKLGAVKEATLRAAFVKDGRAFDQYLWAILAAEWRACRDQGRLGLPAIRAAMASAPSTPARRPRTGDTMYRSGSASAGART